MSYTSTQAWDTGQRYCQRPGCTRYVKPTSNGRTYTTCSRECDSYLTHYEQAHALAEALGPSELTDSYLVGVRKLMALWDEVSKTRAAIRKHAQSVGIAGDSWGALLRGQSSQSHRAG